VRTMCPAARQRRLSTVRAGPGGARRAVVRAGRLRSPRLRVLAAATRTELAALAALATLATTAALAALAPAAHAAVPPGWTIAASDARHLELRITVARPLSTEVAANGRVYRALAIAGYAPGGESGDPALPEAGAWIGVPPSGPVELSVRVLETVDLGGGRLIPNPTPYRVSPTPFGEPSLGERIEEGPAYAGHRADRANVAMLGHATWSRKQRIVPLRVSPVIFDAAGERLELVTQLELTITFPSGADASLLEEGAPDPVLLRSLLNPEVAAGWRALPPRQRALRDGFAHLAAAQAIPQARPQPGPQPGPQAIPPVGARGTAQVQGDIRPLDPAALISDEYRVRVDATGLARVHLADVLALGFPSDVPRRKLRLYQKRWNDPTDGLFDAQSPLPLTADVPCVFAGNLDPDGIVTVNDDLIFYAFHPRDDDLVRDIGGQTFPRAGGTERSDNFNGTNVYWIAAVEPDAAGWARMESIALPAAVPPLQTHYRRVDRLESDNAYQDNPQDIEQPRYNWTSFLDASPTVGLEFQNPVPGALADVTWSLVARVIDGRARAIAATISNANGTDTLATVDVGIRNFATLYPTTGQVPSDFVGSGFSTFQLRRTDGSPLLQAYLGDITLAYDAQYRAVRDEARLRTGQPGGQPSVEVPGFSAADVMLLEITDPRAPRVAALAPANLRAEGDATFTLAVQVAQAPALERSFWALRPSRATRVRADHIERATVRDLITDARVFPEGQAQVLAIGPAFLESAMQPWLAWRRAHDRQGWKYAYIDVQAIVDQFSGGLKSPEGIKRFLEYAYLAWNARAVLLVGEASEEAREVTGDGGRDLVPSPLHVQVFTDNEVLGSDKWYATFNVNPDYPNQLDHGPDMVIGRLTANDAPELSLLVQKIIAYEQPQASDDWRRRCLWVADDDWSSQTLGGPQGSYCWQFTEAGFELSQRSVEAINDSLDTAVQPVHFYLKEYTDPMHPGNGCTSIQQIIQRVGTEVTPLLMSRLNEGALIVSFQGHANWNVLCHERLFTDVEALALTNAGRPFVFFGMGCHISDFLSYKENQPGTGRSIGQLLLSNANGGAIATYGSNGFEFLRQNSKLMEKIGEAVFTRGRTDSPIFGTPWALTGQWTLGEVLGQGEHDVLPSTSTLERQMVAQYNLLGDPLLRLDAAPPRLTVESGGQPVADQTAVVLPAGSDTLALQLHGVDESGVDRFVVGDSRGRAYSGALQYAATSDPRKRSATINIPIEAFGGPLVVQDPHGPRGYRITIDAYDGSYPDARPSSLRLVVPFTLTVSVDGTPVDEGAGSLSPETASALEIEFVSPISLTEAQIDVHLTAVVALAGPTKTALDADGRRWRVALSARGDGSGLAQALRLTLAGSATDFSLTQTAAAAGLAISVHYPFPSPGDPSRSPIWFVAQTTTPVEWSRVTVYDLTGRAVARLDGSATDANLRVAIAWDGRDAQGDEAANGVYLYRLEVGHGLERVRSDMGRVVLMR
jgi:hypothetical protein